MWLLVLYLVLVALVLVFNWGCHKGGSEMDDELMEEAIIFLKQFKHVGERYEQAEDRTITIHTYAWQGFLIEIITPATKPLGRCNMFKDNKNIKHFGKSEICTPVEIYGVVDEWLKGDQQNIKKGEKSE